MDYRQPYPTVTRDKLSRFVAMRCPSAPKDIGGKIWDACQETDINPGIMACIAISKSKNFTSNRDIFACHIEGTFEDQVVNAVLQYTHMKPEDLMLPQIQWTSVELKYVGLLAWCRNSESDKPAPPPPAPTQDPTRPHPNMPDPVPPAPVEPPKPVPVDPTKPAPVEPDKPKKKIPWKMIAVVASGIALALKFAPVPAIVTLIADYVVKLLQAIPQ